MSRDSGSEQPSQRTVAELLAEYGGGSQRSARRRRRRAEDPSETAPQAIIDRVLSDSGQMRAVSDEEAAAGQRPPSPPTNAPGPPQQAPPYQSQQPAAPPPAAPGPQAPQEPSEQNEGPAAGGANFWAQRFAAAGSGPAKPSPPAQPQQPEPAPDAGRRDFESTLQQPALPRPPQPSPRAQPTPQQPPEATGVDVPAVGPPGGVPPRPQPPTEGATEQFPRFGPGEDEVEANGTAVYIQPQGGDVGVDEFADPYDFEPYEYESGFADRAFREDGYDREPPAGMESDDYLADDAEKQPRSPGREWIVLAGQVGVGLLGGGVLWVGFRWLWIEIPLAALVAALVVTGALVLIARKFLRTDDLQTILLAVLVGLTCTVSPAALLLVGQ